MKILYEAPCTMPSLAPRAGATARDNPPRAPGVVKRTRRPGSRQEVPVASGADLLALLAPRVSYDEPLVVARTLAFDSQPWAIAATTEGSVLVGLLTGSPT